MEETERIYELVMKDPKKFKWLVLGVIIILGMLFMLVGYQLGFNEGSLTCPGILNQSIEYITNHYHG